MTKPLWEFFDGVTQHRSRHDPVMPPEKSLFGFQVPIANFPKHPADDFVNQIVDMCMIFFLIFGSSAQPIERVLIGVVYLFSSGTLKNHIKVEKEDEKHENYQRIVLN